MDPSCRTWRTARALLLIYGSPPRKFLECYDIVCWVTLPNLWAQNSWLHRMLDWVRLLLPNSEFRAPLIQGCHVFPSAWPLVWPEPLTPSSLYSKRNILRPCRYSYCQTWCWIWKRQTIEVHQINWERYSSSIVAGLFAVMDLKRCRLRQIQNWSVDLLLMDVKMMWRFLSQPQDWLTRCVTCNLCEAFIVLIRLQLEIGR